MSFFCKLNFLVSILEILKGTYYMNIEMRAWVGAIQCLIHRKKPKVLHVRLATNTRHYSRFPSWSPGAEGMLSEITQNCRAILCRWSLRRLAGSSLSPRVYIYFTV